MHKPKPGQTIYLKDDPAYWQALGRFIEAFAEVEDCMFETLAWYSNIPDTAARAIFSGTRVDAASRLIRRLIQVHPISDERKTELDSVLPQLKAILEMRNQLMHYGSYLTDEARLTSNSRTLLPDDEIETRTSKEILEAMTNDLHKIMAHLVMQRFMPTASFQERSKYMPGLTDAWLYIPDKPKPHLRADKD